MAESGAKLMRVPYHVAIIMDGNGRWAQQRGRPRLDGHRAGTDNIRRILECCAEQGVKMLTLYAFSTENWNRPTDEVNGLMGLPEIFLRRELKNLHKNGVRLRHIGRLEGIAPNVKAQVLDAIELTKHNDRIVLNIAFNYGGRVEILEAVRRIVADGIRPDDIDETLFGRYLYTQGEPDPDLVIRTAGEMRLSNFLIWQAAYAEYYSTPTYWPDFDRAELLHAFEAYDQRERKFGKTGEQLRAEAVASLVGPRA
ncbi:MAG: isoprenyl transferase [Chloroflexota bacterium]